MDTDACAFCGIAIEGWYDPRLPKSCWKRECRNQEAAEINMGGDE